MKFKKTVAELKQISDFASQLAVQKGVSFTDGLALDGISEIKLFTELQEEHKKSHELFQKQNKEVIEKSIELFKEDTEKREEYIRNANPKGYKQYIDLIRGLNEKEIEFDFEPINIQQFKDVEENVRAIVFALKKVGIITK